MADPEPQAQARADALIESLLPRATDDHQLAALCSHKGRILLFAAGPRPAIPWFELAGSLNPYSGYRSNLAMAYWEIGNRSAAADQAEMALAGLPYDPTVIEECGGILIEAGRIGVAITALKRLAGRDYEIPQYYIAIAECLLRAGQHRTGLALVTRAVKRYPESLDTARFASQALLMAGRKKLAARVFRRLLKLDPAGHGKVALMNLALIAADEGNSKAMLRYAVTAGLDYNDRDTRRLLKRAVKAVSGELRERESSLKRVAAELSATVRKHEALQASLAGYDLTEGGSNLEFAIREGEGWHIEFMELMPDHARDLGREIAALSSQDNGGTIFLGIRDNGTVVGIGDVGTLQQRDSWRHRIAQIATKTVQPPNPVTVYFNARAGRDVIKIWVPEGSEPIYYVDSIPYIRNIDESRKATPAEVEEYFARRSTRGKRNGR